jgi:hypothetical protein
MAQAELGVNYEHLEMVNKNTGDEDADKHEYLTGPRLLVVISIVITVAFLLFLESSIIVAVSDTHYFQFRYSIRALLLFSNPTKQAFPQIITEFQSISDIGWCGSAYLLAK